MADISHHELWARVRMPGMADVPVLLRAETTAGAVARWCADVWKVPASTFLLMGPRGQPLKERHVVAERCGLRPTHSSDPSHFPIVVAMPGTLTPAAAASPSSSPLSSSPNTSPMAPETTTSPAAKLRRVRTVASHITSLMDALEKTPIAKRRTAAGSSSLSSSSSPSVSSSTAAAATARWGQRGARAVMAAARADQQTNENTAVAFRARIAEIRGAVHGLSLSLILETQAAEAAAAKAEAANARAAAADGELASLRAKCRALVAEKTRTNKAMLEMAETVESERRRAAALAALISRGGDDGREGGASSGSAAEAEAGLAGLNGVRQMAANKMAAPSFKRRIELANEAGQVFQASLRRQDDILASLIDHDDVQTTLSNNLDMLLEWRLGHASGPLKTSSKAVQATGPAG